MAMFTLKKLLPAFFSLLIISNLHAQEKQLNASVGKDNFTSFTTASKQPAKAWTELNSSFLNHPDAALAAQVAEPGGMVELFGKRTESSKYFINPVTPSEFVMEQSTGAIHYQKGGQWLAIDTRLSRVSNGLFEASHQAEPVGFDVKSKASFIKANGATVYFNQWELHGQKNGASNTLLAIANWSDYTAGDNGLYINNIFPGIDASMRIRKGAVKTSFIIRKNQFPAYSALLFKDKFNAGSAASTLNFVGSGAIGDVNFKANGKNVMQISKGLEFTETQNKEHVAFQELPYILEGNQLTISADAAYINTQLAFGNVVIDPLVQTISTLAKASITGSMNCGSATNSCSYTVPVTPPASATITQVTIKFQMFINAPLTLDQGKFSIAAPGGCGSTTTIATANTTVGPNIVYTPDSVNTLNVAGFWDALSTTFLPCLPTNTSCSPAVLPFTLRFWNTYCATGSTGCSNTYVYADMDFSIRVRGNTLVVPGITRSTNIPICQGQSVTLSRNVGNTATAPLTYQWLPGNQTTSSVTVSPAVTTFYTSTVSDSCGVAFTDTTTVVIIPIPNAPVVTSPVSLCQYEIAASLASKATGTSLRWYLTPVGGVASTTAPTPSTMVPGTYNFYVVQTSTCGESPRAQITVIVNPKPAPPTVTTPLRLCQYDSVALSADGVNTRWYLHPTGGGGQSPYVPPTGGTDDSTYYYATQTVNGCESDRSRLLVTVSYKPNGIISPTRAIVCQEEQDSFYYFGNARPDAFYNWTSPNPQTAEIAGAGTQGPYIVRFDSAGTYNVNVQVNNRGCLSEIATFPIIVRPRPTLLFVAKGDACVDEIINVALSAVSPAIDSFNYSFPGGVIRYGAASGGPYGVVYSTPGTKIISNTAYFKGCPSRITNDTITVHGLPDARFTVNSVSGASSFCTGDSILLTAFETDSNAHFVWLPDNFYASGNVYTAKGTLRKSGYAMLKLTSRYGCTASDSIYVKTENCCGVFFPNAFSPNGDGKNDVFRPVTRGHHEVRTFRIINRWGQTVYESQDENRGWDGIYNGKPQDLGTYYYYIAYTCGDGGGDSPREQFEEKGEFLLIR